MDLQQFFSTIDIKKIREFVLNKRGEDLDLEFKTISKSDLSNNEDRKNFAKALSGFANSTGGIVIWGVATKARGPGLPDCADSLQPISDLGTFTGKLQEFTPAFVKPLVDGVIHKAIKANRRSLSGYIKTLIPEGTGQPHRAESGLAYYYKRNGSSFIRLEHFDLEDMFGRRKKPKLKINVKLERGSGHGSAIGGPVYTIRAVLGILNEGRACAKAPYLSYVCPGGWITSRYGVDSNGSFGLTRLISSHYDIWNSFGGDANIVIHPGVVRQISAIEREFTEQSAIGDGDHKLHFRFVAEDLSLSEEMVIIPGKSIAEVFKTSGPLDVVI